MTKTIREPHDAGGEDASTARHDASAEELFEGRDLESRIAQAREKRERVLAERARNNVRPRATIIGVPPLPNDRENPPQRKVDPARAAERAAMMRDLQSTGAALMPNSRIVPDRSDGAATPSAAPSAKGGIPSRLQVGPRILPVALVSIVVLTIGARHTEIATLLPTAVAPTTTAPVAPAVAVGPVGLFEIDAASFDPPSDADGGASPGPLPSSSAEIEIAANRDGAPSLRDVPAGAFPPGTLGSAPPGPEVDAGDRPASAIAPDADPAPPAPTGNAALEAPSDPVRLAAMPVADPVVDGLSAPEVASRFGGVGDLGRYRVRLVAGDAATREATAARLAGYGIGRIDATAASLRPVDDVVRFYHAEDAELASLLADILGASLQDLSSFRPRPDRAEIDILLAAP